MKTRQRVHLVDGSFQFKPVPAGSYRLRVLDPSGHVIATLAATEFPLRDWVVAEAFVENNFPSLAVIQVRQFISSSASDCERPSLERWVEMAREAPLRFERR